MRAGTEPLWCTFVARTVSEARKMDSVTQIALGAAVGTAVLGRKVGARAALWGAVCGTLPDLDVLVAYGDPVRDFTYHRAESHSLFWLTLASPPLALLIARLNRSSGAGFREWLALVWLALVTHPLLDAFTVYGTQLLLPFSDYPAGIGSIFIIDPMYTLPLVVGVLGALWLRRRDPGRAQRWNAAGLVASSAYLLWTVAAQSHVGGVVHRSLAAGPISDGRVLVTPSPFNSLLWRIVVMDDGGYHEGYRSLLDRSDTVVLARHASEARLLEPLQQDWTVRRLAWFSKGFYGVRQARAEDRFATGSASTVGQLLGLVETAAAGDGAAALEQPIVMTDLRMGQTHWFVFSFVVADLRDGGIVAVPSLQLPTQRPPVSAALGWLGRRIFDEQAGPPPGGT
jgi:inner membrane protein